MRGSRRAEQQQGEPSWPHVPAGGLAFCREFLRASDGTPPLQKPDDDDHQDHNQEQVDQVPPIGNASQPSSQRMIRMMTIVSSV